MLEFTGERVVPGQVDADLWNEHFARYLFAARLARRKRVLDIGCGAGYGSAELARVADSVTAFDVAPDAVAQARASYHAPHLNYLAASATAIPFANASFDLVTCYEVIEHIEGYADLLKEVRRLLAPGAQFIVSTPNKTYYAETRDQIGPNPYHVREFTYDEFRAMLSEHFASVKMYVQNHVGALSFQPIEAHPQQTAELSLEAAQATIDDAHFFVAVCALTPQTGAPAFLHVPSTSNVLRERESHIHKLEAEIGLKDKWLDEIKTSLASMVEEHRKQTAELEAAQRWAQNEHAQFLESRQELLRTCETYEKRLAEQEQRYAAHLAELNKRVEEAVAAAESMRSMLTAVRESRWLRLGRSINLGPKIEGF